MNKGPASAGPFLLSAGAVPAVNPCADCYNASSATRNIAGKESNAAERTRGKMTEAVIISSLGWDPGSGSLQLEFRQAPDILFDLDFQVLLVDASGQEALSHHIGQAGWNISWLPAGVYGVTVRPDLNGIAPGIYTLRFTVSSDVNRDIVHHASETIEAEVLPSPPGSIGTTHWQMEHRGGLDLSGLSWKKGYSDWFFVHFDHAANVVIDLMLKQSPRLKGRILDVGCGDGVTDLGIFLRCQPEVLIGVDPFKGYERLPEIAEKNLLPPSVLDDSRLRFEPHSGNQLPYPDDDFDVVLSWGSLEHIAGGYLDTLSEIRRVLKPGGLLFVHPGLFYSTLGNHLGEFFDDPFIHLKIPEEELRERVLSATPKYMDRAGYFAEPRDYWRWYQELNPITVPQIETELRDMGFEPWRVALRTADVIEYSPELQRYGMADLAISEMYASFVLKAEP